MKVEDRRRKYVVMNEHEWLEIAAHLPRNHRLRGYFFKRAEQIGQTWSEFSPEEWPDIEHAALAAGILTIDEVEP